MFPGNKYFCAFSMNITWGKCGIFFSPTVTNIDSKILYYLVQVQCFQQTFFWLLIVRTGRKEKIHNNVANCFYLKLLKLVHLTNRCGENLKSLLVHFSKENCNGTKKRQSKLTKNQMKPEKRKTKFKTKQPVK